MLPQSILDKVLAKYGKDRVFAADCAPLAAEIGISESTVKRMFGLYGATSAERGRTPHASTMDILAKWLGYDGYEEILAEIGEGGSSSEFTALESIDVAELTPGVQVQLSYHPSRRIKMTYMGDFEFVVDDSLNSKLLAGDRLRITHLIKNQELIAGEVTRGGCSLGAYRGAKDGGLTSLMINGVRAWS